MTRRPAIVAEHVIGRPHAAAGNRARGWRSARGGPAAALLALLSACGEPDASRAAPVEPERHATVEKPEARPRPAPAAAAAPTEKATGSVPPLIRGRSRIPEALRGGWRVTAQTVAGDGVQAYGDNDPALVGARATITESGASWSGSASPLTGACEDAFFDGETAGAALAAVREEHAGPLRRVGASVEGLRDLRFLCMGEGSDWGPAEEELRLLLLSDGRLVVPYFDNLLLVLVKG